VPIDCQDSLSSELSVRSFSDLVCRALCLTPPRAKRIRALLEASAVRLSRRSPRELAVELGLSPDEAFRLAATFEVGRRIEAARWSELGSVKTPEDVYRLLAPKLRGREREVLFVLTLDGRHRLTGCHRVSEGTLTASLVHPREVFAVAIRAAAAAIIVAHNHPSGDPEPSAEDLEVTRRLSDSGKLLGIPLLDHVVVGQGAYVSIRDRIAI
jgi:DNA repair protein RadC